MNVTGQGNRMTVKPLDIGGGLFRSRSKGLQGTGLFAVSGFMDLLAPVKMEIDSRKGMPSETPVFGMGIQPPVPDDISAENGIKIIGDALAGEELCDNGISNHIDGLIAEVDRSLVAGNDPSELLAMLLDDARNMSGKIAVPGKSDPSVVETDDRRIFGRVITPDTKSDTGTDRRVTGMADSFAARNKGISGRMSVKESEIPVETLMNLDPVEAAPEVRSGDTEIDESHRLHPGSGEVRKSRTAISTKNTSGEALTGKLIENLRSGAPLTLPGQTMREMDDPKLKVEREPIRTNRSSQTRNEVLEQTAIAAEPDRDGITLPESSWTVKDELIEMVRRQGSDESRVLSTELRETHHENVTSIHQPEVVKTVGNVQRVSSIQKEQILDTARQGLMEQIGNVVSRNGAQEIKLTLSPPELGEMKIRVEIRGKRIRASILVESVAVKAAIDAGTGRLSEAVMREGFALENLDVSVNDNDKQLDWDMYEDEIPVGSAIKGKPVLAGRLAERVRNDSGGIDLLV